NRVRRASETSVRRCAVPAKAERSSLVDLPPRSQPAFPRLQAAAARHADEGQDYHIGQQFGGLERLARSQNRVAVARIGAEKFSDDDAYQRPGERHPDAADDERNGERESDVPENLPL